VETTGEEGKTETVDVGKNGKDGHPGTHNALCSSRCVRTHVYSSQVVKSSRIASGTRDKSDRCCVLLAASKGIHREL